MTVNEQRRVELAKEALIRATEALLFPTKQNRGAALLWMGMAMLHIVRSDEDQGVLELVMEKLERVKSSHG